MSLSTLLRWPAALRRQKPPAPRSEIDQLDALPRVTCVADALGRYAATDLRTLLTSADAHRHWEDDRALLESLELPEAGWGVNPGDRRALYCLVLGLRPRVILEIGTHIGCSTVHLARAAHAVGADLHTADVYDVNDLVVRPWQAHGGRQSPRELCGAAGCGAAVTFHTADSLTLLRQEGRRFDLIFLDGLHDAPQVYQEIPLALQRLTPGGFIILHDFFPDRQPLWSNGSVIAGPWLAVQRLQREGAPLAALPLGELPWPTKLGSCVTSLALLTRAS